jgi:hypothetical protein
LLTAISLSGRADDWIGRFAQEFSPRATLPGASRLAKGGTDVQQGAIGCPIEPADRSLTAVLNLLFSPGPSSPQQQQNRAPAPHPVSPTAQAAIIIAAQAYGVP